MGINSIIYLAEAALMLIALIVGFIIFEIKLKKGYLKFLGISMVAFFVIFGTTFVLERPDVNITEIKDIEVKSGETIKNAKTNYHFFDISDNVKITGDVDYNKVGDYNVKFEVDTWIGKYEKDAVIKVVDTKAPVIILEGEENYNQSYSNEYEEPGVKAIDEYEGDISSKIKTTKQEQGEDKFSIKYEVSDSAGNKAEKIRKVTIVDDVPPEIELNGSENMTITIGGTYEEKGATAEDEKDGDLSEKIEIEGDVDTSKAGTYEITYKVSDTKGNEATKIRTVTVKQKLVASNVQAQAGNGNGVIYLTFDDGPSSNITPQILDILKRKNVKAIFFVLNYNATGEALIQREVAEGHTVGIHGYSHDYNTIYQSEEAYMSNITRLQEKIKNSTGYTATITRFPGGSSNTVSRYNPGIMTRLCNLVVARGFKYFDWNVSSGDAGGAQNSQQVYANVVGGLSKSKQNVVLMHDFSGNYKTLNALEDIIDYGIENGYSFSRITESTPMVTHRPNN